MSSTTLIVYVHGALSTKNSWNYIRQNLINRLTNDPSRSEKDRPHEEFIHYNLNKETSDDIVVDMVEKIQSWVTDKGIKKLILIAHSFGGVLSVATVRKLSDFFKASKVKPRIITLSSPFAGSEIAAVLRIFKPGSVFFKNIGDHTDFIKDFKRHPLPCHTHSFITTEGSADWMPQDNDGVVTINSQMYFEDDINFAHQEVKSNHFEILLSDLVVTQLFKEAK
jgi:pimeloyl-ACP methyl ester carboxylesterase